MLYKENELPDKERKNRKHDSEPYKWVYVCSPNAYVINIDNFLFFSRSPTHAGGLFAMNRKYFLEIGGYDPGLLVWGGENFELSFKVR